MMQTKTQSALSDKDKLLLSCILADSKGIPLFSPESLSKVTEVRKDADRILADVVNGEIYHNLQGVALAAYCKFYMLNSESSTLRKFLVEASSAYVVNTSSLSANDRIALAAEIRKFICDCVELRNHLGILITWE